MLRLKLREPNNYSPDSAWEAAQAGYHGEVLPLVRTRSPAQSLADAARRAGLCVWGWIDTAADPEHPGHRVNLGNPSDAEWAAGRVRRLVEACPTLDAYVLAGLDWTAAPSGPVHPAPPHIAALVGLCEDLVPAFPLVPLLPARAGIGRLSVPLLPGRRWLGVLMGELPVFQVTEALLALRELAPQVSLAVAGPGPDAAMAAAAEAGGAEALIVTPYRTHGRI